MFHEADESKLHLKLLSVGLETDIRQHYFAVLTNYGVYYPQEVQRSSGRSKSLQGITER